MTGYQFILCLTGVAGLVLLAAIAIVGVIVVYLVKGLDQLVNGWHPGGDDDDGPFDPPPPVDPLPGRALNPPAQLDRVPPSGPADPDLRTLATDQLVLATAVDDVIARCRPTAGADPSGCPGLWCEDNCRGRPGSGS